VAAAQQPSALAGVQPGLWEISGAAAPIRQCVTAVVALAEFEHRGRACKPKIISDRGHSIVVEYSCGAAGFGRSQIDVITPRSLRIDTQGISEQLPFRYVLQARRIGDCASTSTPSSH
jgi:hypothetical protein